MSDGLKFLSLVVENGSGSLLRDVPADLFVEDEVEVYRFIRSHYRRYSVIPALATVEEELDCELPEAEETPEYYRKKLFDRRLYAQLRGQFSRFRDSLSSFDMDTARTVISEMNSATRIAYSDNDIRNLTEAGQAVLDRYDYVHSRPGMSGIPTLWSRYDEVTSGYQVGDLITYVARPEMGKCMAPDTPVLTYLGEVVRIDSLRVGDRLMGPDSSPRTVLSTTRGTDPMYRIVPSRGESWVCNGAHILYLKCVKALDRVHTAGSYHLYSVDAYLALPARVRRALSLVRTGVEFPECGTPPVEPYFVGLWLGDGTVGSVTISTMDPEIVDYLTAFACREGGTVVRRESRQGFCQQYALVGGQVADYVRWYVRTQLYVDGQKRVPRIYLTGSRETRLHVLAGMLDSDGHLHENGAGFEWISQYPKLADDMTFLARSCGFGVTRRVKVVNGKDYYRLYLSGALHQVPTKIARKRASIRGDAPDTVNSAFSVEPLGLGEYFGITLDKDHLYLLGDFTVTHNTMTMLRHAAAAFSYGASVLIVSMEMPIEQIMRRMLGLFTGIDPNLIKRGQVSTSARRRLGEYVANVAGADRLKIFAGGMKRHVADVDLLIQEFCPDIVFIDGVYLMAAENRNVRTTTERVSEVFTESKQLVLARNVPMVVTTQYNRASGKKGKDGSLENIAYSDAISTHSSIILSIQEGVPGRERETRVAALIKGRDGEQGQFPYSYRFRPVNLDELADEDIAELDNETGDGSSLDWTA